MYVPCAPLPSKLTLLMHTHPVCVQELLHTAVKHDVVVVVPCIPCAPPRIDAPPEVLQSWMSRCHAFAALTALGGVPSVVVPVGQLPNGGGPLAVALFGHSRGDTRLVVVAQKLAYAAQVKDIKAGLMLLCMVGL